MIKIICLCIMFACHNGEHVVVRKKVNRMLMLSLDDAVKVTKRLVDDGMGDKEIIRQELEQKCWLPSETDDAAKTLSDLICDINPAEICAQIEADNLRRWCEKMQVIMKMAMVQLPCWGEGEQDA